VPSHHDYSLNHRHGFTASVTASDAHIKERDLGDGEYARGLSRLNRLMNSRREFVNSAIGLTTTTLAATVGALGGQPTPGSPTKSDGTTPQIRDRCGKPFRVAVALGESTTAGGTATSPNLTWVSRLADLINESQVEPVKMINSGIGANVVSRRSSEYDHSGKPSAMERYPKHVIAQRPDLVLVSYGLNDARAGTPLAQFLEDVQHIVSDIKDQTGALMMIVNAYFMTRSDGYVSFNKGNIATLMGYNCGLKYLAEECDTLYADVFAAEGMATWMIDPDGVHANNLGHRVIANRIFEVLAQNCSCLSQKAFELRKNFKPWRDESVLKKVY
jgi:lysophospholipase L1-like esterase